MFHGAVTVWEVTNDSFSSRFHACHLSVGQAEAVFTWKWSDMTSWKTKLAFCLFSSVSDCGRLTHILNSTDTNRHIHTHTHTHTRAHKTHTGHPEELLLPADPEEDQDPSSEPVTTTLWYKMVELNMTAHFIICLFVYVCEREWDCVCVCVCV